MAFRRVNGIVIHYKVLGRAGAPALVFANSLGSDFRIWDEVASALADHYRVVLYDKRGHGLSDAPSGLYTVDEHVDDLLSLLETLKVSELAIVGLSVGGLIAQRLAVRLPERVRALVLCDTAAKIGTAEAWAERIDAVERGGIDGIADRILERWFTREFRDTRLEDYTGWRNMLVRTPAAGYASTCATVRDTDLTSAAASIRAPTLCVVGNEDGSTPPELVRATADLIPGATFKIIDNAGHIPCIDQPQALTQLIRHHLQEAGYV